MEVQIYHFINKLIQIKPCLHLSYNKTLDKSIVWPKILKNLYRIFNKIFILSKVNMKDAKIYHYINNYEVIKLIFEL